MNITGLYRVQVSENYRFLPQRFKIFMLTIVGEAKVALFNRQVIFLLSEETSKQMVNLYSVVKLL